MRLSPIGEKRWEIKRHDSRRVRRDRFSARQREEREKEIGEELGTDSVSDNTELESGSSN